MLDGDLTIENAPLALNLKGELYGANAAWGVGPYGDNPLMNVSGVPEGALRYIGTTTVQPPDDTDGCVAILPASGATAGTPGTFTPQGAAPSLNLQALIDSEPPVVADPTGAWSSGEYVELGDLTFAHWDGNDWVVGVAP